MIGLLALLGGLLYRARGTDWREHGIRWAGTNTLSRPLWCVPTGLYVAWLAGGGWSLALACAVALWAGLLIPHAMAQDNGTRGGTPLIDACLMSLIGFARGGLIGAPLSLTAHDTLAVAAIIGWSLAGPAYWIGWRVRWAAPDVPLIRPGTLGPPEFLTGAAAWAALYAATTI